jgi:hypothetical protein
MPVNIHRIAEVPMSTRDATTVHLQVRIREDLRASLEESAKAKRISLNQEIVDRLEYVRDRKSLLAEVMRLAFGERLAGLLIALGLAMRLAASMRPRAERRQAASPPSEAPADWMDDPKKYDRAAQSALVLLEIARPEARAPIRPADGGVHVIDAAHAFMIYMSMERPTASRRQKLYLEPFVPWSEIEDVKKLLGPVAERIITRARQPKPSNSFAAPIVVELIAGGMLEVVNREAETSDGPTAPEHPAEPEPGEKVAPTPAAAKRPSPPKRRA